MNKFKNTFKVYLNTLLSLSKNYCFRDSINQNELPKQVGDMIEFAYAKGFLMSYCMGVAETCKSVIFNQEKIEGLKKLGNEKMRNEYHKIQKKLDSESAKIIEELVVGYKNNSKYFDAQLERHNLTMKTFFYITSETKNFSELSDKFKDMDIKKIATFYLKHLNNFISQCEEKYENSKNPYDKFVSPHEEQYVGLYTSKKLREINIDITPHTIQGYSYGIADTLNLSNTINLPSKENKFYLLSFLQNKNISFKEKSVISELIESKEELTKHKI